MDAKVFFYIINNIIFNFLRYILGYLATLLCIKVHEPDSVTLIKATRVFFL